MSPSNSLRSCRRRRRARLVVVGLLVGAGFAAGVAGGVAAGVVPAQTHRDSRPLAGAALAPDASSWGGVNLGPDASSWG